MQKKNNWQNVTPHPIATPHFHSKQSCAGILTASIADGETSESYSVWNPGNRSRKRFIWPRTCTVLRGSSLRKTTQNHKRIIKLRALEQASVTGERSWCLTFLSLMLSPSSQSGKVLWLSLVQKRLSGGLGGASTEERQVAWSLLDHQILRKPLNLPASVSPLQSGANMLGQH